MKHALLVLLVLGLCAGSSSAQSMREVKVYFQNVTRELHDQNAGDSTAFPVAAYGVPRSVDTRYSIRQALVQLLKGPTPTERDSGYTSGLDGLRLVRLTVYRHRATIHLRGRLQLAGVLSEPRMRLQVKRTMLQFPRIRHVSLIINGRRSFNDLR